MFGKMCFELLMLHGGTGTAPSGVFQGPRPHLAITSGTSSQAVPRCLYLLSVWPGKSVLLSSQVSLPIIYSKAPHGLIPPDPFETHSRSCASQVGSLSRDTTLPPPIVHLLRLKAPLCMTVSPPALSARPPASRPTEKWLKWLRKTGGRDCEWRSCASDRQGGGESPVLKGSLPIFCRDRDCGIRSQMQSSTTKGKLIAWPPSDKNSERKRAERRKEGGRGDALWYGSISIPALT
ncbi:hypothetical protein F7725_028993 [Dissostichus mawsoni]|uniref:Uncharacterized protein n=1 Tax=Dissostichus mawsoni TaxID=36200 RepID=A0A7J5XH80_DISMA|nr:hypothetical protein F7725_028993 [Dissostichus mawsoni]